MIHPAFIARYDIEQKELPLNSIAIQQLRASL